MFSDMMKKINKMINKGITEISKNDVKAVFDTEANDQLCEELKYLGCTVERNADLFNVKFNEKFTREEINHQKRIEALLQAI